MNDKVISSVAIILKHLINDNPMDVTAKSEGTPIYIKFQRKKGHKFFRLPFHIEVGHDEGFHIHLYLHDDRALGGAKEWLRGTGKKLKDYLEENEEGEKYLCLMVGKYPPKAIEEAQHSVTMYLMSYFNYLRKIREAQDS